MKFPDYLKSLVGQAEHAPASVIGVLVNNNAEDYKDADVLINPTNEEVQNKGCFYYCSSEFLRKTVGEMTPELIDADWDRICLMLNMLNLTSEQTKKNQ